MYIDIIAYILLIAAFCITMGIIIAAIVEFIKTNTIIASMSDTFTNEDMANKFPALKAIYLGQENGPALKLFDKNDYISKEELINYCKNFIKFEWSRNIAPSSWAEAYEEFIDLLERWK